jgi:hypothetical protein
MSREFGFLARHRLFLLYNLHTSYAAHPTSYPMGTEASFLAVNWPGNEAYCPLTPNAGYKCAELYLDSPIHLHGMVI